MGACHAVELTAEAVLGEVKAEIVAASLLEFCQRCSCGKDMPHVERHADAQEEGDDGKAKRWRYV